MKLLTKEEEKEHYNETLKGGLLGGSLGLALGVGGLYFATARYPAFRHMTLPLRTFLVTSSGTFGAIVTADHFSRAHESSRDAKEQYQDEASKARELQYEQKSGYDKLMAWGQKNRYYIVGGSWVASMALSIGLVGRNPYLSTSQKLVQARVYAQTLTIAVLIATAAFEIGDQSRGEGRWETVQIVDPKDPKHEHLVEKKVHQERYPGEDQWKDMVESEERKMEQREQAVHDQELKDERAGKYKHKEHGKKHKEDKNEEKKDAGKDSKSNDKK